MEVKMILLELNKILTNPIIEILKLIGGLAGIAALIWKFYDIRKRYIKLKIAINHTEKTISILTAVENPTSSPKKIDNALLIISPEEEDIVPAINSITQVKKEVPEIKSITDLKNYKPTEKLYVDNRYAILPLKYFYSGVENVHIADESITYRSSLDKSKFNSGNYSVRFYVYCGGRYPRSSQDLLTIY
ncbi:hypothetical protein ES705_30851 [subsurface metagenome]